MSAYFEIQGFKFDLKTLELPDACKGVQLVSEIVGPAMRAPEMATAIGGAMGRLPELLDLFAPYCEVRGPGVAEGRKVPLKSFRSEVFNGRLDLAMLFAANCAAAEFGDFLGAGLERLSAGLAELAPRWPSPKGQSHSSGD
jgi:hypothetical protein